jgi:hypothetical protein
MLLFVRVLITGKEGKGKEKGRERKERKRGNNIVLLVRCRGK